MSKWAAVVTIPLTAESESEAYLQARGVTVGIGVDFKLDVHPLDENGNVQPSTDISHRLHAFGVARHLLDRGEHAV